jgi:hypothetical protein
MAFGDAVQQPPIAVRLAERLVALRGGAAVGHSLSSSNDQTRTARRAGDETHLRLGTRLTFSEWPAVVLLFRRQLSSSAGRSACRCGGPKDRQQDEQEEHPAAAMNDIRGKHRQLAAVSGWEYHAKGSL